MKLPGADYARGQSSFGRDTSDATSISRAEFGAASAKGKVAAALNRTSEVFKAWAYAEDEIRAAQAASDYAEKMSKTIETIRSSPTVKAANLPEGALRNDDEREVVPTWEVAPAIYDSLEKPAYDEAVKAPLSRSVRARLETQIKASRARNSAAVSKYYVSNKRKDMEGKLDEAVKKAVIAGQPDLAIQHIDRGVAAGIYDYKEAVKKKNKVLHDVEDLQVARLVAEAKTPKALTLLSDAILMKDNTRLTPDERRAYASQAASKAERIYNKQDRERTRWEKARSKKLLSELALQIRFENKIPTSSQMREAMQTLEPADALSFLALVDRKDGRLGQGVTDPDTMRSLDLKIGGLGLPVAGTTVDQRADAIYDDINTSVAKNMLTREDGDKMIARLDRFRDRPLNNPSYTLAEETLTANIVPPKTILESVGLEDATRYASLAAQAKVELAEAVSKNPKLKPQEWVEQNLPRFRALVKETAYKKLHKIGLGSYTKLEPDGTLDVIGTKAALEEARRKKQLTGEELQQGVNAVMAAGRASSRKK